MNPSKQIATILMLFLAVGCSHLFAQASKNDASKPQKSEDQTEAEKVVRARVNELLEQVGSQEFAKASKKMTPEARDAFAVSVVEAAAIGNEMGKSLKTQLGPMAAQFGLGGSDKLEAILQKYGLDELGISGQMQQFSMSINGQVQEQSRKANGQTDGNIHERILQILDQDEKRWEIISEISANSSSALFSGPSLSGEVKEIELSDDQKTAFVTLKPKAANRQQQNGRMGQMMQMSVQSSSPGSVIEMVNQKGDWLYAGLDTVRTSQLPSPQIQGWGGTGGSPFGSGGTQRSRFGKRFGGEFDDFDKQ